MKNWKKNKTERNGATQEKKREETGKKKGENWQNWKKKNGRGGDKEVIVKTG